MKSNDRLPNAESAVVTERKVTHYLLAPEHPRGGPKAAFFERFGFIRKDWHILADALCAHALAHDVMKSFETPHGTVYEVVGGLTSPNGRNPAVRVVWFVDNGSTTPRLSTVIPGKKPK